MRPRTDHPEGALWVSEDVRFKVDVFRSYLTKKWGKEPTMSEIVDWLCDEVGPPEEE